MSTVMLAGGGSAQSAGFVYVATNDPAGNAVVQFARAADGTLTQGSQAVTGGLGGTGNGVGNLDPLGSEDSLVLNGQGNTILVVNAGSNELSSLAAGAGGVRLVSKVPSGGSFPNSVALAGSLAYVVNAHGTPNISGFRLASDGTLTQLPGSTRPLPGGANAVPHDVRFSPDGSRLLVSEQGTNQIDVFEIGADGLAGAVVTNPAAGAGPFGMRFGRGGVLANAEAGSASVSSYVLNANDSLTTISGAVADGQAATCWITLTGDGKFAFVSNTGSGTLSTYQLSGNGTLTLADAVTASLGGGAPIDSALSSDGAFLYVEDSAQGQIASFVVHGASLSPLSIVRGLPTTLQGIAAQ